MDANALGLAAGMKPCAGYFLATSSSLLETFEWSSIIERRGRRRQPLLVAVGPKQDTSQFVTGDSESTQDLMRHRRPAAGPTADGGAHGPAHGSPSTASARVISRRQGSAPQHLIEAYARLVPVVRRTSPRPKRSNAQPPKMKVATVTARGGDR
jgi:hypothetical protein